MSTPNMPALDHKLSCHLKHRGTSHFFPKDKINLLGLPGELLEVEKHQIVIGALYGYSLLDSSLGT